MNFSDIAQIIAKFLFQDWKFDYCYDYDNKGPTRHGIENNGKTAKCNYNINGICDCFFSIFSIAMKPQSGTYKIKFKINEIDNNDYGSIIGIISSNCKNNKKIQNDKNNINTFNNKSFSWYEEFNAFIGWCACDENDALLPSGLYCGLYENIFHTNNWIYCSNNENYKQRLPGFYNNDIIVLQYNSYLSILSFSKENDNNKLDSYIKNLPKNETFYWFVGHSERKMHLTIVH